MLGLCELGNAPDMQKCPKTFVHDCSLSTDTPSPKKKQKSGRESIFLGEGTSTRAMSLPIHKILLIAIGFRYAYLLDSDLSEG